jgi:hypothetical protein
MNLKTSSLVALIFSAAISAGSAFAADTTPAATKTLTPQQQKMKDCNAQAGDKKGDERKTFMSQCLKADSAPATTPPPPAAAAAPAKPVSQQQKMKDCNADATAKKLTGDDRKAFMSTCLKGSPAPAAQ